jgi:predicted ester cyclase
VHQQEDKKTVGIILSRFIEQLRAGILTESYRRAKLCLLLFRKKKVLKIVWKNTKSLEPIKSWVSNEASVKKALKILSATLKIETVCSSETQVSTRRYNQQDQRDINMTWPPQRQQVSFTENCFTRVFSSEMVTNPFYDPRSLCLWRVLLVSGVGERLSDAEVML